MIRNVIFAVIYYGGTAVIGVLMLPSLVLPQRLYWPVVRLYFRWVYWVERMFLGLDYRVIGLDHLPTDRPIIIAAKHYAAYETLKLPLLFDRPVVIVKRELLLIPFWGWYAAKAGMIGINRARPRAALATMQAGVGRALAAGKVVVIFPQGTRVRLNDTPITKPYKRGLYALARAHGAAVVPLALNSGAFCPRDQFIKRPGVVTLAFLPPIDPALNEEDFMSKLEHQLETESNRLVNAATTTPATPRPRFWTLPNIIMLAFVVVVGGYTALWFTGAAIMQRAINQAWANPEPGVTLSNPAPKVSGFLGPYTITWGGRVKNRDLDLRVPAMTVRFWPIPTTNLTVNAPQGFKAQSRRLQTFQTGSVKADRFSMSVQIPGHVPPVWTKPEVQKLVDQKVAYHMPALDIIGLVAAGPRLDVHGRNGTLTFDQTLQPTGQMDMTITGLAHITDALTAQLSDVLPSNTKNAMGLAVARTALGSLMGTKKNAKTGADQTNLTLTLKNGKVRAGMVPLGSIGRIYWPVQAPSP